MQAFQPLIDEHDQVYKIIRELKDTLNSTDEYEVLNTIRNFRGTLDEIIRKHFSAEEEILFPRLIGKEIDGTELVECVLNEHKAIKEKESLLSELLAKYEAKPQNLAFQTLIQTTSELADMLYNHAYGEDSILFAFAGTKLNEEDQNIIAKELAKISCECCPKHHKQ